MTTSMFSQSSDIAKTFVLLCLKCYVDKEDNLMCHASFNVYDFYCLHLSHHQLSGLSKALLAKTLYQAEFCLYFHTLKPTSSLESTIPSYSWYSTTTPKVYNL